MRPFSTFTERTELLLRMSVAYGMVLLLFALNIILVSYPLTGEIKAPLFLMALYYWAIYRPKLIPVWLTFVLACIMDVISLYPVGLSALIYISLQWVVSDQRRYFVGQSFVVVWFGFMVVSLVSLLAQWVMFSVIYMRPLSVETLWGGLLLGIALFPFVCIMLHLTHKILPAPTKRLGAQG